MSSPSFNPLASSFLDDDDENEEHKAFGSHSELRFSFAYQPIVDIGRRCIFAHEALVRGEAGEAAASVLMQLSHSNRYRFDEACHRKAIKMAAAMGLNTKLSLNVLPNGMDESDLWLQSTAIAAALFEIEPNQIILETTESEKVRNAPVFANAFHEFRRLGFLTAIDDFGAGYSGLELLADFQPDIVKLDIALIRDIHTSRPRQIIAKKVAEICVALGIYIVVEGVETIDQYKCLCDLGFTLMQGYLFSRPRFQALAADLVDDQGRVVLPTQLAI